MKRLSTASGGHTEAIHVAEKPPSRTNDAEASRRAEQGLSQFAPLECPPSREHLVGVHTMRPGHLGDTRPGFQDQL